MRIFVLIALLTLSACGAATPDPADRTTKAEAAALNDAAAMLDTPLPPPPPADAGAAGNASANTAQ